MFLGEFGRRVDVARVGRSVLGDQAGAQFGAAARTEWLEPAGVQVGRCTRPGTHRAVGRTVVAALAVDDHGSGEHQTADARFRHGGQQHRGPEVVAADVVGCVAEVLAETDHRRLVAHRVHAAQGAGHRAGVADVRVDPFGIGQRRRLGVGGRQQGVEDDGTVSTVGEGPGDVRADEARASGDKYTHIRTVRCPGLRGPSPGARVIDP